MRSCRGVFGNSGPGCARAPSRRHRGVLLAFLVLGNLLAGGLAAAEPERLPSVRAQKQEASDRAKEAGIDLGGVVERVRHHVASLPGRPGLLRTEDRLYRADFEASGFGLSLRRLESAGEQSLPDALPFENRQSLRIEVTRVGAGARVLAAPPTLWRARENQAERTLAPGIVERVTARDEALEWDFVLGGPPAGDLRIEARVLAAGEPTLVRKATREQPDLPAPALRFPAGARRFVRVGEVVVKDASGREIHRALPRLVEEGLELAVPAGVLGRARYPVTVDPTVSPEYPMPWGGAKANQLNPAVAWSGSSFLVVWADARNFAASGFDIYGARVDAAGAVLDPGGIAISTATANQIDPAAAWLGSSFLVAWEDNRNFSASGTDIFGTRMTASGTVLNATGIAISTATSNQVDPAVASITGVSFLVVWEDNRNSATSGLDIFGARVDPAGVVLEPGGIAISTATAGQADPVVAWNGSLFLVVWEDDRNSATSGTDIFGAKVTGGGTVMDTSGIAISTAAASQTDPAAAWFGSSFLVVWEDQRNVATSGADIFGTLVSGGGTVFNPGGIGISTATASQVDPAVATTGVSFLVVWEDHRNSAASGADIFGARVNASGAVLDPAGIAVSTAPADQVDPAVAPGGSSFLAAWQDNRNSATSAADIVGARVDPGGGVLDPTGITISTAPADQFDPAVAWSGSVYLVAWHDARNAATSGTDIYGARLDSAGALLDPAGIAISKAAAGQFTPAVAWGGERFLVVWRDDRNASTSGIDIYGARVSEAGALLDPAGIAISTATATQRDPGLAWSGASFLVVWEDGRNSATTGFDVYGARVSEAGALLDPAGIAISTATVTQADPGLAWSGASFLVVWEDGRNAMTNAEDVYGARVSPDGTVADPGGFAVSLVSGGTQQVDPAVSWSGSSFLVAWMDSRNISSGAGTDIYGTRVSSAGAVLNTAGIPICTVTGDQIGRVAVAWSGSSFVVVWGDSRNFAATGYDVYGTRLSSSGAVLDGAGFPVATSGDDESPSGVVSGPTDRVAVAYDRGDGSATRALLRFVDDPSNDAFAFARAIGGVAGGTDGVSVGATKEVGKPDHAGNPGGHSVWFRWTAPVSGPATFDTISEVSTFDTTLAVYTGSVVDALTRIASNDDSGNPSCPKCSAVSFVARAGTAYRIAVDGAGGAGGAFGLDWSSVEDAIPPDTTITSGPTGTASSTSAVFGFTATEAGSSFECALDGQGFAPCASPKTYAGLSEGTHHFEVRATDLAGNTDLSPAERFWIVDAAAPETAITAGPSGATNSASASFSFGASEAGSTFACSLDGAAYAACTSPHAVMGLAEGSHSFAVRATDGAGNTDPTPASRSWTVDTTAPDTSIDSGPSGTVASTGATFTFSASEAGSSFACSLDAAASTSCSSPKAYDSLGAGTHAFEVRSIDAAGNTDSTPASRTWSVDLSGPAATITSGPSGTVASAAASFGFSSTEAGATFQCALDGTPYTACSSPKGYAGLADGPHLFEVRALDSAGNAGAADSRAWTVDTTSPETAITAGPSGATNSASASFSFGASEAGSTFACSLDGAAYAACTSPHAVMGLAEGGHTFAVRATDGAGNTDPTPASRSWTVDTTAPDTAITAGPSGTTAATAATFEFGATEGGSVFACSLDGGAFVACSSPKTYTGLAEGTHTFAVRATDPAGNTDPTPASRTWTVATTAIDVAILRPLGGLYVNDQAIAQAGPMPVVVGNLTVTAFADDPVSGIASFRFEVDGAPVPPSEVVFDPATGVYRFLWDPSVPGTHTIVARATNGAGLSNFASTQVMAVPA